MEVAVKVKELEHSVLRLMQAFEQETGATISGCGIERPMLEGDEDLVSLFRLDASIEWRGAFGIREEQP